MNITKTINIDASPDRVWKFMINADLMTEWLMEPVGFMPVVGNQFTFISECDGETVEIQCEVLTVVPEVELSFTWVDRSAGLDSVVAISLTHNGGATRVDLRQSGWKLHLGALKTQHATTWQECLVVLKGVCDRDRST